MVVVRPILSHDCQKTPKYFHMLCIAMLFPTSDIIWLKTMFVFWRNHRLWALLYPPITIVSTVVQVFYVYLFLCAENIISYQPFIAEPELVVAALVWLVCVTDGEQTWVVIFSGMHWLSIMHLGLRKCFEFGAIWCINEGTISIEPQ